MQDHSRSLFWMILGLACLFAGIAALGVAVYLIPQVFFDRNYHLPEIIYRLLELIAKDSETLPKDYLKPLFWALMASGVGFIMLARTILMLQERRSRKQEQIREKHANITTTEIPKWQRTTDERFNGNWSQSRTSRIHPVIFILLIILIALFILLFVEWLIYR